MRVLHQRSTCTTQKMSGYHNFLCLNKLIQIPAVVKYLKYEENKFLQFTKFYSKNPVQRKRKQKTSRYYPFKLYNMQSMLGHTMYMYNFHLFIFYLFSFSSSSFSLSLCLPFAPSRRRSLSSSACYLSHFFLRFHKTKDFQCIHMQYIVYGLAMRAEDEYRTGLLCFSY